MKKIIVTMLFSFSVFSLSAQDRRLEKWTRQQFNRTNRQGRAIILTLLTQILRDIKQSS